MFAVSASADVLVSTIGQSGGHSYELNSEDVAQEFTTGTNSAGYTLTSIEIKIQVFSGGSTTTPTVKVFSGSATGTEVATLNGPASLTANTTTDYTFNASGTVTLDASTKYWVVAEGTAGSVHATGSDNEDGTPATGWSVANTAQTRSSSSSGSFTDVADTWVLLIRVNGAAKNVPEVLVSNIGQINNNGFALNRFDFAQAFTTGTNSSGYTLTSAEIKISGSGGQPSYSVSIWSATSGGLPDTSLGTLTNPATLTAGDIEFTTTGIALETSTTYFLVLDSGGSGGFDTRFTSSDNEDANTATGWSLSDGNLFRNATGVTTWTTDDSSWMIRINGTSNSDSTAPSLVHATVDGTSLVLTFDEDLAAATSLANSAFEVKRTRSGSESTVSLTGNPSISNTTVTLTLATAVVATDTLVKVSYTKPDSGTDNVLKDAADNEVANINEAPVINITGDSTVPSTESAEVQGSTLDIFFSEPLAPAEIANSAFTVKKTPQGNPRETVTLTGSPSISGVADDEGISRSKVTLTLSAAVVATDTAITVSYTKPGSGDVLEDFAGNDVATFTDLEVVACPSGQPTDALLTACLIVVEDAAESHIGFDAAKGSLIPNSFIYDSTAIFITLLTHKYSSNELEMWFDEDISTSTTSNWLIQVDDQIWAMRDARYDNTFYAYTWTGGSGVFVDGRRHSFSLTVDSTAPTVSSAIVNGDALTIEFNEPLAAVTNLAAGAFTVKRTRNGTEDTVAVTSTPTVTDAFVALTLADRLVVTDDLVKVSYAKPGSGDVLEDLAGNDVGNFTDQAVTNQSRANQRPVTANPIPNQEVIVGVPFSFMVPTDTFSDPDDDPLTIDFLSKPGFVSFNSATLTFTGTPPVLEQFVIVVLATDPHGASQSTRASFDVINNDPIVAKPIPDLGATVDVPFDYTVPADSFTDPDGHTLRYRVTGNKPSWLSIDNVTLRFTGTPRSTDTGTSRLTVSVIDSYAGFTSDTFDLTVTEVPNNAPTLANAIPDQNTNEESSFSYTFPTNTFNDPDNDTLTYSASGMPTWLSFDDGTRTFSGSPALGDQGRFDITVTASDNRGGTVTDTFAINVRPSRSINRPPEVDHPIPDQHANVGELFDYTFREDTFDDPDGAHMTYTASGIPTWLSFDGAVRRFYGTPGSGDTGTSTVTVTAEDVKGRRGSDEFMLTVTNRMHSQTHNHTDDPSAHTEVHMHNHATDQSHPSSDRNAVHAHSEGVTHEPFPDTTSSTSDGHVHGTMRDSRDRLIEGWQTGVVRNRDLDTPRACLLYGLGLLETADGRNPAHEVAHTADVDELWYEIHVTSRALHDENAQCHRHTCPSNTGSMVASVTGALLQLGWLAEHDTFTTPHPEDFVVHVDGEPLTVVRTARDRQSVWLELASPVQPDQTVRIDYLGSAMYPLRADDGAFDRPWQDVEVRNVTGVASNTATTHPSTVRNANVYRSSDGMSLNLARQDLTDAMLASMLEPHDALRRLNLSGNALTDLWSLRAQDGLRELNLSHNRLTDLAALGGLDQLESLDLSDNGVTDVGALRSLSSLRRLDLTGNAISDLSPLASLPYLEVLLLDGNRIEDVGALAHHTQLKHLSVADNALVDLSPLANLASLRRLDVSRNPAKDFSVIDGLSSLVWLKVPETSPNMTLDDLRSLRWVWPRTLQKHLACK